jgi:hypothetical protein
MFPGALGEEFFLRVADQLPRLHVASVHDVIRDVGENIRRVNPGGQFVAHRLALRAFSAMSCVLRALFNLERVEPFIYGHRISYLPVSLFCYR